MSNEKILEEFEHDWGFTNEEQNIYFIPELNMYGSEVVNSAAERKSTAWFYFQKGFASGKANIEVELPFSPDPYDPDIAWANQGFIKSITAAGLKVKS